MAQKRRGSVETLWRPEHDGRLARTERVRAGWRDLAKDWQPCSSALSLFQNALTVDYGCYSDNSAFRRGNNSVT